MERVIWRGVALGSGALAALAFRQAAAALWRARRHEDPPTHPGSPRVGWTETLIWTTSIAVGAAVARVIAERTAAKAWERATGKPPPGVDE